MRFFVVADGAIELSKDDGWRMSLVPGDYFGEIALLRDTPRTASAQGEGPALLYALSRDDFLAGVTGHARAVEAADAVVSARLEAPGAAVVAEDGAAGSAAGGR